MMYKERFVVVIKQNGRILRERDGVVTLPFGSEYSLLFKNLESVKAVVNVFIDGEDVLDGNSVIVHPNSSLDFKGFMLGTRVGNKFKFINKTKRIADYRGDRIDDGLVRVEFKFEKKKVTKIIKEKRIPYKLPPVCPWCGCFPCVCYHYRWVQPEKKWLEPTFDDGISTAFFTNSYTDCSSAKCSFTSSNSSCFTPAPDEGITVKGSETRQDFSYGCTDTLGESSSVIVIKLRGTNSNGTTVKKPLTVRTILTCSTCGKKSKSTAKFCRNCGTYLE